MYQQNQEEDVEEIEGITDEDLIVDDNGGFSISNKEFTSQELTHKSVITANN